MDEHGLALIEQHSIHTAISSVKRIYRDYRQAVAVKEHKVPDVGNAGGNRDAAQAGAVTERSVPDAGDRQAIDRVGDGHRSVGSGVSRDGDRAVIGRVSQLGAHHVRKCQQHGAQ